MATVTFTSNHLIKLMFLQVHAICHQSLLNYSGYQMKPETFILCIQDHCSWGFILLIHLYIRVLFIAHTVSPCIMSLSSPVKYVSFSFEMCLIIHWKTPIFPLGNNSLHFLTLYSPPFLPSYVCMHAYIMELSLFFCIHTHAHTHFIDS